MGDERTRAEAALIGHLESLQAIDVPMVGVFIAHDGEPDLMPLVRHIWRSGRAVALPVLQPDARDASMRFVPWNEGTALVPGRYDIPVPPNQEQSSVAPDTLLVSFTGFDATGNRMGRGGGFFDRYLARYEGQVVGVGFEVQRFEQVPVEPHDQRLPRVVTDLGVRFIP